MEERVQAFELMVRFLGGNKRSSQSSSAQNDAARKDLLGKFKLLNSVNRVNGTDYNKESQGHLVDVLSEDKMYANLGADHSSVTFDTQKSASRSGGLLEIKT